MAYIPEVDEDACSMHADCESIAPEVFRVDAVAVVIGTGPDELIMAAAEACPSTAIRVTDSDTGEQVYP
ncbi:MAG TPA: ferredoxin [Solirubrobacteraceae bacterium]|jgi:ferredoxin